MSRTVIGDLGKTYNEIDPCNRTITGVTGGVKLSFQSFPTVSGYVEYRYVVKTSSRTYRSADVRARLPSDFTNWHTLLPEINSSMENDKELSLVIDGNNLCLTRPSARGMPTKELLE